MALTENFNSYTDGDLVGQGSWTAGEGGTANFDIQGSIVQEGAKAVINQTGANATVYKTFTTEETGEQEFYARPDAGNLGMATLICVSDNTNVAITIGHTAEADSTWHKYNVQWDGRRVRGAGGTGQYKVKVDDGAWGAWTDGDISFTTLGAITLRKGGEAQPSYWDSFTSKMISFSISDTFSLTESMSTAKGYVISVSDTLGITEAISTLRGVIISVTDSIGIGEYKTISTLWTRVTKSVSTWTNRNKSQDL